MQGGTAPGFVPCPAQLPLALALALALALVAVPGRELPASEEADSLCAFIGGQVGGRRCCGKSVSMRWWGWSRRMGAETGRNRMKERGGEQSRVLDVPEHKGSCSEGGSRPRTSPHRASADPCCLCTTQT